jgi:carbonic anhydrase
MFDELVRRNRVYIESGGPGKLTPVPATGVLIVTCIDPRVEPAAFLGIEPGDAIVLRNSGGRINDGTLADIAFISALAEAMGVDGPPLEVAVVHHTGCGSSFLADDGFRRRFAGRTGFVEADLLASAVTDPHATVRTDVQRLLSSPLATERIVVSGHVLDLQTGLVETVLAPAAPPLTSRGPSATASAPVGT